jgi:hypothetical protein
MRIAIQDNRRAALENHQSLRLNEFKDLTVSLKAARGIFVCKLSLTGKIFKFYSCKNLKIFKRRNQLKL